MVLVRICIMPESFDILNPNQAEVSETLIVIKIRQCGSIKILKSAVGSLWSNMAPMVLNGLMWSCIDRYEPIYGPVWPCMVTYGPIWSRMVLNGPV